MNGLASRFDGWVRRGDSTALDLGRFRIVFAAFLLLAPPDFTWVSAFPDSFVNGPAGPFMLLTSVPPQPVVQGLEVALGIAAAFVLVGCWTRAASVLLALVLLAGLGTGYSLGKIDHTIFLLLVPVLLSLAGWGDALSVDALRRRRRARPEPQTQQWPMRLLALLIGLGFVTAAVPKLISGWLSPATQAVQGTLFTQFYVNDRTDLLAGWFLRLRNVPLWESLDVATVLLEGFLVLAVISWRSWRVGIAIATLFHVGVLLMMNIPFASNVMSYAAFVLWSRLPLPRVRWSVRTQRVWRTAGPAVAVAIGLLAVLRPDGLRVPHQGDLVVVAGALVAAWYLLGVGRDLAQRAVQRRRAGRSVRVVDTTDENTTDENTTARR